MDTTTTPDLIADAARALIGSEVQRRTGPVVAREFQRWAAAVGDRNPLYFDAGYARAHGYRDVIAPPLFLPLATLGAIDLDDLRPDGVPAGFLGVVPLPLTPRLMAGGDEYEFHEPAYPGDVVTGVRHVSALTQKQGRSGPFVVVVCTTTYTNQEEVVLARITDTVLALP